MSARRQSKIAIQPWYCLLKINATRQKVVYFAVFGILSASCAALISSSLSDLTSSDSPFAGDSLPRNPENTANCDCSQRRKVGELLLTIQSGNPIVYTKRMPTAAVAVM